MSLTFRETTYTELWGQGYPQETFGQQASEATRVYLVPWESRQQARLDFLGYSEAILTPGTLADGNPGTIYYLSRTIPDFHPGYLRPDGTPFLWADSVTFEPFGVPLDAEGQPIYGDESTIDDEGEPVYNTAKMTVHYSTRLYRILDDATLALEGGISDGLLDESSLLRYVETPFGVAAQYLQLPDGTFVVASPPTDINGNNVSAYVTVGPVPGAPGKIEGQWDVTLIWRQVPRRMIAASAIMAPVLGSGVKNAAFDYAIGRVNATTFGGYPAGTLLCEPMEFVQWIQADGETVFDVTFHFKYYYRGWNYLWTKGNAASSNKMYCVQVAVGPSATYNAAPVPGTDDGKFIYDPYEFHNLFYGYDYSAGIVS